MSTVLAAGVALPLDQGLVDNPVTLLLVLAGIGLLPFVALALTSFVKIAVVFSIARTAIGAQQVPPNLVITGLAVVLSLHVMAPVAEAAYGELEREAPHPESLLQRATRAAAPVRDFLLAHSSEEDRAAFLELAARMRPETTVHDTDFSVLMPAFLIGELRDAFRIGFLLFLPFLVVDLVVSTVLLSLGMHMLSPTTVSLPFKLLLFVAADGWRLIAEGLVAGYLPR
ncbi:MAG: EscR/YscR/HrcR family type III secretion system export apparatus protein [Deltaproteobacteria bacterium]|nr:MAG: EscR/YscR/HrcR family type III secretion system export apparatus protein [Deltaproteobacteria bacterium]